MWFYLELILRCIYKLNLPSKTFKFLKITAEKNRPLEKKYAIVFEIV